MKRKQGYLETWLIPGQVLGMYKLSLEHLIEAERKKYLWKFPLMLHLCQRCLDPVGQSPPGSCFLKPLLGGDAPERMEAGP